MSTSRSAQPDKPALIILGGIILLLTTAYVVNNKIEDKNQRRIENARIAQTEADKEVKALAESIRKERESSEANQTLNYQSHWVTLKDSARHASKLLNQLMVVHQRNLQNETELLDADAGVFAANPEQFLVLFSDYQRQLQIASPQIQDWDTRLSSIIKQATNKLSLTETEELPLQEHIEYVPKAQTEIRELLVQMENCDRFLQKRKAELTAAMPVGKTLRAYIAEAADAEERESARILKEKLAELKAVESEKIRKIIIETEREKLAAERLMAEDRRKAQNEKLERERRELEASLAAEKAEAEAKEKMAADDRALKADMRQIEKLLYQFTTKAHKQLKPNGYFELTSEPTAISLKALIAYGALTPGNEGNFKLKQAMGRMAEKNDRPQPPIDVSAFDHSNAIPIQNLLIKHGDAMVRAGLLAP